MRVHGAALGRPARHGAAGAIRAGGAAHTTGVQRGTVLARGAGLRHAVAAALIAQRARGARSCARVAIGAAGAERAGAFVGGHHRTVPSRGARGAVGCSDVVGAPKAAGRRPREGKKPLWAGGAFAHGRGGLVRPRAAGRACGGGNPAAVIAVFARSAGLTDRSGNRPRGVAELARGARSARDGTGERAVRASAAGLAE